MNNEIIIITALATLFICLLVSLILKLKKSIYRDEEGHFYRSLTQKEKNYCWELLDNCFYNLYHNNSVDTRQINYKEYQFISDLLLNGIPLFCGGLYYIERKTPEEITRAYSRKQQKDKTSKEKYAPGTYGAYQDGKLFKRLKSNGVIIEVSEEEFLQNAYHEEIERYYNIKEALEREKAVN